MSTIAFKEQIDGLLLNWTRNKNIYKFSLTNTTEKGIFLKELKSMWEK